MNAILAKRNLALIPRWSKDGLPPPTEEDDLYPESDGEPMSDSTLQWEWIDRIKGGLEAQYLGDPNVFVAGDLLWYSVEGDSGIRTAPDAMVVFGRPKGHRRSYLQWREGGIAPQVAFEIWSYSNRPPDKVKKLDFYNRYGVEEYYALDPRPSKRSLQGWVRRQGSLIELANLNGWKSPRLGITFRREEGEWRLYHPDGEVFVNYEDLHAQRNAERAAKEAAWAKLRELGIDPETI
jgi:Uma2 family endonuclease